MYREYKKIDIFVNGKYECTTTRAKTCKEAKDNFCNKYNLSPVYNKIQAFFNKN